jgi:hypothetical protein
MVLCEARISPRQGKAEGDVVLKPNSIHLHTSDMNDLVKT